MDPSIDVVENTICFHEIEGVRARISAETCVCVLVAVFTASILCWHVVQTYLSATSKNRGHIYVS